jgi:hypothetical protein
MVKRKQMDDDTEGIVAPPSTIVDDIALPSSGKEDICHDNASTLIETVVCEGKSPTAPMSVALTVASPKAQPLKVRVSLSPSDATNVSSLLLPVALPPSTVSTTLESSLSSRIWEDMGILRHILSYVGNHQYRFIACVNKSFHTAYEEEFPASHYTFWNASTVAFAKICFEEMDVNPLDQSNLASSAVKHGCIPALEYLKSVKCEFDVGPCTVAAWTGQLHILQWLLYNGYPADDRICSRAAEHGHLHVLQWLREKKFPWDAETCAMAAKNGHLELLQWARSKRCRWDEHTCAFAAEYGHFELLKWARSKKCPWDESTCSGAAESGNLDMLQWARSKKCPWNEGTCSGAAHNGHLHVLQWARANLCPWNEETCANAAKQGHLHLLQWARANQCPWDKETCTNAARNGHLVLLQWVRANQCPWSEETCAAAAENGHLDVLQWLRSNDCPWDRTTCERAIEGVI